MRVGEMRCRQSEAYAHTVGKMRVEDVLGLFHCFQDCYCYSNNDIMYHVTKYCNVIGLHCTVRRDMACIHSLPDASLSCRSGSGLRDQCVPWSPSHVPRPRPAFCRLQYEKVGEGLVSFLTCVTSGQKEWQEGFNCVWAHRAQNSQQSQGTR